MTTGGRKWFQKTRLFRTWLRSDEIADEYVCRAIRGETRNVYDLGKRLRLLTVYVMQSKVFSCKIVCNDRRMER